MKTYRLYFSLFCFISVLFTFCKNRPVGEQGNEIIIDSLRRPELIWGRLDKVQQDSLKDFVLKNYFNKVEGDISYMADTGRALTVDTAVMLTQAYYLSLGTSSTLPPRFGAAKSVYFEAQEVIEFLEQIREDGMCPPGNTLGVRFYLAKYPPTYGNVGNPLRNQNTIILRGVCNGVDLPHSLQPGHNVAWNFGDVCPPVCDLSNPTKICTGGGEYNPNGAFSRTCP